MLLLGIGIIALVVVVALQHRQIKELWEAYDSMATTMHELSGRLPRR